MAEEVMAALRDVTFYRCPSGFGINPRTPKYHIILPREGNGYGPGPACGIPFHVDGGEIPAKSVAEHIRCMKPGCRAQWEKLDEERKMADSKRPFCFECSNQLTYINGAPVYEVRDYHGTPVKLHKECAKHWDGDKALTVQEIKEPRRHD